MIIPRLPAQLHHPVAPAAPAAVAQPAIDSPVYLENYMFRIGFGYDVHCLVEGRRLILGGVDIPWECGLLGHSDADVLVHAIMDGILGALGRGDIGKHFPDADPSYKDKNSLLMLHEVMLMVREDGYSINNIDCTIVAQKPKLAPYIDRMREKLSGILNVDAVRVNIKATTTERLGFAGRGEGMEAYSVVSLVKTDQGNNDN